MCFLCNGSFVRGLPAELEKEVDIPLWLALAKPFTGAETNIYILFFKEESAIVKCLDMNNVTSLLNIN